LALRRDSSASTESTLLRLCCIYCCWERECWEEPLSLSPPMLISTSRKIATQRQEQEQEQKQEQKQVQT
jgi:hypothetical protein